MGQTYPLNFKYRKKKTFHGNIFFGINIFTEMQQMLVIFALLLVCSARASTNRSLLELQVEDLAKEAKRARQEFRQADADLHAEMQEIKRLRRNNIDSDVIADLKALIRSEIHSYKGNMSECEVGTKKTTKGKGKTQTSGGVGFTDTIPISFGRNFKRVPKVSVAISEFIRSQQSSDPWWGLRVEARNLKTDSFRLYLEGVSTRVESLTA